MIYITDVLLHLVHNVGQLLLLRLCLFCDIRCGLPGLRQEGWLLVRVLLVGILEARGDDSNLYGVLHGVILNGAEDDVGILMRGFLNHAGGFVHFMQRKA